METVDEILSNVRSISTNQEDFKEQLEGRTVRNVRLEGGSIHIDLENGEQVEIDTNAPPEFNPNIVTEQGITA